MAPVVMALGAVFFWIGVFLAVNPHGIARLRRRADSAGSPNGRYTAWRAVGVVLVVVGIVTMLLAGAPA
ncbi:MAG: hypothetical protein SVG88_13270 [Halobacteriales archaeon]|nr:hypothetical protein [Halobacteriales archaeon]